MVLATRDRAAGFWVPGYWKNEAEKDVPPTEDELLNLFKEGRRYFEPFYAQCRNEEAYILGTKAIPHPAGVDPVWPATAYSIVQTATDHVDVNNLSIDVPAPPRARARAERIKKFYQGAWLAIKDPVLRTVVDQSFLYGIGWLRTMFAAEKWPDAPKLDDFPGDNDYREAMADFQDLRCISWPLAVDVIKPTNMIWDDSRSDRPRWAIEWYEMPMRDLARRYPAWALEADSQQMSSFFMYWDEEWVSYMVNQKLVVQGRHGYGFMPMTPLLPAMSHTFADGPPQDRYKGILHHAHSLLDEEARLMTQMGALVRTNAYRTLDFHGSEQIATKTAEEYELFGGKNVIPSTVTVEASPMLQMPQDLGDQLTRVQNYIEQVTFPNVVRGMRPRGVSAGFAISVMAGMGRLKFQGVADGLRHAIEDVNGKFARLVENKIKGRITVHARTEVHIFDQSIEPDDIKGLYENRVQVKAEAPEEREREGILAMRQYQAGILSLYEAMRRSGIINPLEEQMQIRAEQLLNTPEFIAAQTQLLLDKLGLPNQLAQSVSPTLSGALTPGTNTGSQNLGGSQLQRPGEANIQRARVASNQNGARVFPQGMGGLDSLGSILGGATGGAQGVPSGQTVRR